MKSQFKLRKWFLLYFLVIHFALLILVFKTNFLVILGKTVGLVPPEEWSISVYEQIIKTSERATHAPNGSVFLLGDSLIVNLGEPTWTRPVVNLGIGGDTVRTLKGRLSTLKTLDAGYLFFLGVGVNDLKYRKTQEILTDYTQLLEHLPEKRPYWLIGIFPVDEHGSAAKARHYLRNANISEFNAHLKELCRKRTNCRYVDPEANLGFSQQQVNSNDYKADGWHLSNVGAARVNHVLGSLLEQQLPQ